MTFSPSPANLPLDGGTAGATVEVDLLRCGESLAPPGWFYRSEAQGSWLRAIGRGVPRSEWLRSPIGAYLVRHPRVPPFLVDTGLHPSAARHVAKDFGRINALAFTTLSMDPNDAVSGQLRASGISADEISLVVMTHLHVDHTSDMPEFSRATFVCAQAEWEAANARFGALNGYARRHLPAPQRVRTISFSGKGVEAHGPFTKTVDLFGDGSVRLLSTPGHTKGHLSVLVRLRNGEALLAGDAVYTRRSLRESLLPWRTADDEQFLSSLAELRAYAERHPTVPIIPTHDAGLWDDTRELR